jgi:hypothetical protein
MPPGWREKLRATQSDRDRAVSLLRDMRNYARAFQLANADRFYGTAADEVLIKRAANVIPAAQQETQHRSQVSLEPFLTALKGFVRRIVQAGSPARSSEECFDRTKALLSDRDELRRFREFISGADRLAADLPAEALELDMAQRLARAVDDGRARRRLLDYAKPASTLEGILDLLNLGVIAAAAMTGSALAPIGLGVFAARKTLPALEWLGWVEERYSGPRWPFYLAENTRRVRRVRRERLMRSLTGKRV